LHFNSGISQLRLIFWYKKNLLVSKLQKTLILQEKNTNGVIFKSAQCAKKQKNEAFPGIF